MKHKSIFVLPLVLFGFLTAAHPVKAIDIPAFPSCQSPSGTVVVNYSSGVHGIPGDSGQYIGSDIVYTVSDSQLVQCFCADSDSGIQTNWWKISSLTSDQINYLKNLGWIYIPSGLPWGLQDAPYMAQNTTISCSQPVITPTPTPAPQPCNGCSGPPTAPVCNFTQPPDPQLVSVSRTGSSAQLTWTAVSPVTNYAIFYGTKPGVYTFGVPNTGNVTSFVINDLVPGVQYYFQVRAVNGCMPSQGNTTGQVLGASTVLGLAGTGNLAQIALLGAAFIASLFLAWFSHKSSRRVK